MSIWAVPALYYWAPEAVCRPQTPTLHHSFALCLEMAHFIQLLWNALEIQTGTKFVFKCITLVRRCHWSRPFIWMFSSKCFCIRWSKEPWLVLTLVCNVTACHMHASLYFLFLGFLFNGKGEEVHISVNVMIVRGKMHFYFFLFCNLFPIFLYFCFCKRITCICMSKTWQVQEYVNTKFLCSDSLFSFLHAEVIFSENNVNICKLRQK